MLKFLDGHLPLTGIALIAIDVVLFIATEKLAASDRPLTPLLGSYDAAFVASLIGILIAGLGGTLFLLGVTRSHRDPPFRDRHPRS